MADHLEGGWNIIQHLGHFLAQPAQNAAALRAGTGRRMDDLLAWQVIGQRPANRFRRRPAATPPDARPPLRPSLHAGHRARAVVARSPGSASPTSGRTAGAATWRSAPRICSTRSSRAFSSLTNTCTSPCRASTSVGSVARSTFATEILPPLRSPAHDHRAGESIGRVGRLHRRLRSTRALGSSRLVIPPAPVASSVVACASRCLPTDSRVAQA